MELSNVVDIFKNRRLSPERRANLMQQKTDLEIRRWELSQELETVQSKIEKIDKELE